MDDRVDRHAGIIIDHSTGIESGDHVVVEAEPAADPLVEALGRAIGERGASMSILRDHPVASRAHLEAADPATLETAEPRRAAFEAADASIRIIAPANDREYAEMDPAVLTERRRTMEAVTEARFGTRWLTTLYPTSAGAQNAGMSTRAYEEFVWDATLIDWIEQRDYQERLTRPLEDAAEVHLLAEGTDLRMRIDDMPVMNDHGQHNLPGGEVSTAPIVDSPEGTVMFDVPLMHDGRFIREARLVFENGEVVEFDAVANESTLEGILQTDRGSSRLGELGIGMNRAIDRYTNVVLFDEKIHKTVHLALGRAYEQIVAPGRERNQSAIHVDLISTLDTSAVFRLDGEPIFANGEYQFD